MFHALKSRGDEECPFGVNRVILVVGRLLPVFPWKRTSSGSVAMSQRCQKQPLTCSQLAVFPRALSAILQ